MIRIKTATVLFAIIYIATFSLSAQSVAHEKSRFAVIDPTYSTAVKSPATNLKADGATWIYGPSELECWRLQVLMQRKNSAKLKVGYPGNFHVPFDTVSFRLNLSDTAKLKQIRFRAVGYGKLFINNDLLISFDENPYFITVPVKSGTEIHELRFDLIARNQPPALLIEDAVFSTTLKSWEWKATGEGWQSASHFQQTVSGVPPHELEDPAMILHPVSHEKGLYDFGRELIGYVMVRSDDRPTICVGESMAEALDTLNTEVEQSPGMVQAGNGYWKSRYPLTFRYIHSSTGEKSAVWCKAHFYPAAYRGAFACSDSVLSRVWMNSAYTIRLCMHDFMLDGIKRDRLPWAGDLAMSLMANAYAFNEPEMVRRSLVALGRAGIKEKDVNGIIDYSLWWIISQDHYQLYFGDTAHLQQEWGRIREALDVLFTRCDTMGYLIPKNSWLFIDWVNQEKWSALQILWWWAQESGARLAHRMNDTWLETRLTESAGQLKINLLKLVWNEKNHYWQSKIDTSSSKTRYPNFLAVLSGLATEDQYDGMRKLLEDPAVPPVGTPYMYGFEMMALARLGNVQLMLDRIKNYWGGMLEQGATTFWEAYDPKQTGKEHYEFYGRPYGKSLCHAWSAGPAASLPSEIFGLRPLDDGWRRFLVDPDLGRLEWASVTVPTKFGSIEITIENGEVSIKVPEGTTMVWKGRTITGPFTFNEKIPLRAE